MQECDVHVFCVCVPLVLILREFTSLGGAKMTQYIFLELDQLDFEMIFNKTSQSEQFHCVIIVPPKLLNVIIPIVFSAKINGRKTWLIRSIGKNFLVTFMKAKSIIDVRRKSELLRSGRFSDR